MIVIVEGLTRSSFVGVWTWWIVEQFINKLRDLVKNLFDKILNNNKLTKLIFFIGLWLGIE